MQLTCFFPVGGRLTTALTYAVHAEGRVCNMMCPASVRDMCL